MIRSILCDIEGTTTSLAFAREVLFPISYENMQSFVQQNLHSERLQRDLGEVRREMAIRTQKNPELIPLTDVIQQLKDWIQQDRKIGVLKSIQGQIWKDSFESGQIRSHIYPDVPVQFKKWTDLGIRINIFSSGSIEAQRFIFKYSEFGDLSGFIHSYFDTSTGPKLESESYRKISSSLGLPTTQILFLSDSAEELDFAKQSGMCTTQILRSPEIRRGFHPAASDFFQVQIPA